MNSTCAFRLAPGVALRPERFGGLIYERHSRRLLFVNSPELATLLGELDGVRPLDEVIDTFLARRELPADMRATLLRQLDEFARRALVVAA